MAANRVTIVDVGGYLVKTEVVDGEGPPVVLVSSMGAPGAEWHSVRQLLTTEPTLISYDRPGTGASAGRPAPNRPLTYGAFAAELTTMLERLRVVESVIAVGHSLGSLIIRMFAAHHPQRVAGMVHVDGSVPRLALWPGSGGTADGDGPNATEIDAGAGEAEMSDIVLPVVPGIVLARTPGRWEGQLPDPAIDRIWQRSQAALARDTGADLVIASDSGHRMPRDAPALVAFAIDEVVRAVRDGRTTTRTDPARAATAGGTLHATTDSG